MAEKLGLRAPVTPLPGFTHLNRGGTRNATSWGFASQLPLHTGHAHSALLTAPMQDDTELLPWQPFLTHFLFRSPSRNSVIKHSHPRCGADAQPVLELAALSCLPGLGHAWSWWSMWVAGGKPEGCRRPIRIYSLFFPTQPPPL